MRFPLGAPWPGLLRVGCNPFKVAIGVRLSAGLPASVAQLEGHPAFTRKKCRFDPDRRHHKHSPPNALLDEQPALTRWNQARYLAGAPIFACVTGIKNTSTAQTCRLGGASPPAGTNIRAGEGNRIPPPFKTAGLEVQILPGLRARGETAHAPRLGRGFWGCKSPRAHHELSAGVAELVYAPRSGRGVWRFESSHPHQSSPDGSDGQDASPTQRNTRFNSSVGHQHSWARSRTGICACLRGRNLEVRILSRPPSETWGDSAPPVSGTGIGPVQVRGLRPIFRMLPRASECGIVLS